VSSRRVDAHEPRCPLQDELDDAWLSRTTAG
jgi:hypothetical protein